MLYEVITLYPSQHGAYSLGTKLMENIKTIGDDFIENGYATGLVGKAHFQPLLQTDKYSVITSYSIHYTKLYEYLIYQ